MTTWILAVFALWIAQSLLGSGIRYLTAPELGPSLKDALGGRDHPPKMPVLGERAARAFQNLSEALPVFLGLALLLEIHGAPEGLGHTGALVFLVARLLYVPAYLTAIPGVRTLIWAGGHVGLALMAFAAWQVA